MPVVSTKVPGSSDLIIHDENGKFADNALESAKAIEAILSDEMIWLTISNNAKDLIRSKILKGTGVKKWTELYEKVAK